MIAAFDNLSDSEIEAMFRAPLLACILIAGADGTIDNKEIEGAIDVAKKKANRSKASLLEYFRYVNEDFEDKLKVVLQSLPLDSAERNTVIVDELTRLNAIIPKLNKGFAKDFYGSMKDMAARIASSSGGLLGIKSVGEEEARYVDLPMLKAPS